MIANTLARHSFAPEPQRLPRTASVERPTVLPVAALAGVPALVRQAFGEMVLRHADRAALLDIELIEDRDCLRGREGYAHVAAGAVGDVLSLCRA
jgi:hypothetical protein